MPFSNDEVIIKEIKSKPEIFILIAGVGLFTLSLFYTCFCTDNGCRTAIEALLIGWFALLTGGAGLAWLANPLLIVSWILIAKNKKKAWLFGLLASLFSISFLINKNVIEDEAGHYNPITKIGIGYWLWLSSCVTTFIGSLILKILQHKK